MLALNGGGKEALAGYAKARKIWEDLRAERPADRVYLRNLVRVWDKTGSAQDQMRDAAGALASYRRCLEIGQALYTVDPKARDAVAFARQRVAYVGAINGETDGAEETIEEAIRSYQASASASAEPSNVTLRTIAKAYWVKAEVQKRLDKLPQALRSVHQSLRITEDLLDKDPRNRQFQVDFHQELVQFVDLLRKSGRNREAHEQTARALNFLKPLVEQRDALEMQVEDYVWLLDDDSFPRSGEQRGGPALRTQGGVDESRKRSADTRCAGESVRERFRFHHVVAVEGKAIALLPPGDPTRRAPELRKMLEANRIAFEAKMQTGVDTP